MAFQLNPVDGNGLINDGAWGNEAREVDIPQLCAALVPCWCIIAMVPSKSAWEKLFGMNLSRE